MAVSIPRKFSFRYFTPCFKLIFHQSRARKTEEFTLAEPNVEERINTAPLMAGKFSFRYFFGHHSNRNFLQNRARKTEEFNLAEPNGAKRPS